MKVADTNSAHHRRLTLANASFVSVHYMCFQLGTTYVEELPYDLQTSLYNLGPPREFIPWLLNVA